jgi:DNA-binding ferritin-like protein
MKEESMAKVEEIKKESPVVVAARKQIDELVQLQATAIQNLRTAIEQAKSMEQQSYMIRGKIAAYEEQISSLRKRHGIKE